MFLNTKLASHKYQCTLKNFIANFMLVAYKFMFQPATVNPAYNSLRLFYSQFYINAGNKKNNDYETPCTNESLTLELFALWRS